MLAHVKQQVTVLISNEIGKFSQALKILDDHDVDYFLPESNEGTFGPIRIMFKQKECIPSFIKDIKANGLNHLFVDVLAMDSIDAPLVLNTLSSHGISIQYAYAYDGKTYIRVEEIDMALQAIDDLDTSFISET